jgi:hypothetical protein
MVKNELIDWVPETPTEAAAQWRNIRARIHDEFDRATSSEQRAALLALNQSMMNLAEKGIDPGQLENFREIRGHSYSMLIVKECLVGDKVCAKTAAIVTRREVAAGRMAPNHGLRKLEELAKFAAHVISTRRLAHQYAPKQTGLIRRALALLIR